VADWKDVFDSNSSNPDNPVSAGGFAGGSGNEVDVVLGANVVAVEGIAAGDLSSADANSAASRIY
jgi:hypothetical protein